MLSRFWRSRLWRQTRECPHDTADIPDGYIDNAHIHTLILGSRTHPVTGISTVHWRGYQTDMHEQQPGNGASHNLDSANFAQDKLDDTRRLVIASYSIKLPTRGYLQLQSSVPLLDSLGEKWGIWKQSGKGNKTSMRMLLGMKATKFAVLEEGENFGESCLSSDSRVIFGGNLDQKNPSIQTPRR